MWRLSELYLGSSVEKPNGLSNTYTVESFETVLNALEEMAMLTILVMQMPHVKELCINRGSEP
jgi:hypothetical protein